MNKPLLSIITINFNNASGLRKTMQSVLDLEFKDYEYIIIDGGSTDDSVNVINYFIENTELKDKITYWCSEKDKGIYNAMNKGLTHVNGTLVNMMNSGDCFIPDSLNKLPMWEAQNKNAVLHGAISKYRNEIFIGCEGMPESTIAHTPLCHQASFIPYALHEMYGNYEEQYKIYADFELWNRFKKNSVKFFWINTIICNFDATGISSSNYSKSRWAEKEKIEKLYGNYIKPSKTHRIYNLLKTILHKDKYL